MSGQLASTVPPGSCLGCVRRGERCVDREAIFTIDQLPTCIKHFRTRLMPYLPLLPVAVHMLPGDDGVMHEVPFIMLKPCIEREMMNPKVIEALSCTYDSMASDKHDTYVRLYT